MSGAWAGGLPAPRGGIGGTLAIAGIGVGVGLLALVLSDVSAAWFGYVTAAVVFSTVLVSVRHPRRLMLGIAVLSFQVNAKKYFLYQGGSTFVGASGPVGIEFPLCVLPAFALLMMAAMGIDADREPIVFPRRLLRPMLFYLLAVGLSVLATPERFLWLCYMNQQVLVILVFLAIANAIHDEHDVDLVVNLLLASAAIQALVYFGEAAAGVRFNFEGDFGAIEGGVKAHGGTVHSRSNGLAGFLVPLLVLGVARFLAPRGRASWYVAAAAVGLGGAAMIASAARAAWIGAALGAAVVVVVGTRRKLLSAGRMVLLAAGGIVIAGIFVHELVDRFSSNHARDYEERAALMRMAWNVFLAHPLVGCGAGAYAKVFRQFLSPDLHGRWLFVVHNRFMLVAAEMGIVGVVAFVAMFRAWLRESWGLVATKAPETRLLGVALTGAIAGLLWHAYWDTLTGFPIDGLIAGLMGLTAAASRVAQRTGA